MVTGLWSALKPYPRMKASGLAWVGEIPEHWDVIPNRAVLKKRKVLVGDRHQDYQLLSLTKLGVIVRDISTGRGKFSADMGTSQVVYDGDLVFCLFDIPETPRTVGLSPHNGMITSAYTVFECRNNKLGHFLELFYIAMDDRKLLSPLYSGLRNTIPPSKFLGIKTPIPPLAEQNAIVKYLDYSQRRIRKLIQAKRKLIGLLNEQKQAIIHQAVTRGLDPDVPLKDSGIEWLGQIPKHWEVRKIKQCSKTISKGTTPSTEGRQILSTGSIRFLKAENITSLGIQEKPLCFIDQETDLILKRSRLRKDDILFVIAGATLGKTSVVTEDILPANTNQAIAFIRPNSLINSNYLKSWLETHALKQQIWLNAVQSAQPNLSMSDLGEFSSPVPPQSEQLAIVQYLDQATAEIDQAIDRANREIELLNEYRARLIADVVTGKLDVREIAAALPETDPLANEDLNDPLEEENDLESTDETEED